MAITIIISPATRDANKLTHYHDKPEIEPIKPLNFEKGY